MIKVRFGSHSGSRPTGSWETMGSDNGVIDGEFLVFFIMMEITILYPE